MYLIFSTPTLPLFLFHFRIVQKEWKERKEV